MTELPAISTRSDPVGRVLARLARIFVIIGGICLTAAGLLTVVSVMGRYFINSPIPGDFELVEMACAVAVFSFLPYMIMYERYLRHPNRLDAKNPSKSK